MWNIIKLRCGQIRNDFCGSFLCNILGFYDEKYFLRMFYDEAVGPVKIHLLFKYKHIQ